MKTKTKLMVFILVLGALILGTYALLTFSIFDKPKEEIVSKVLSPDAKYIVTVMHRFPGATAMDCTLIFLNKQKDGEKTDKDHLVFSEDYVERPTLHWMSDDTLMIEYSAPEKPVISQPKYNISVQTKLISHSPMK